MAAISLIKFTQGTLTDLAGRALKGFSGVLVVVTNGDNTDVQSWLVELLYAPPDSNLTPGVLASNTNNSTPTASFSPDATGCYRVRLTVWDAPAYGGAQNVDIRNFAIALSQGIIQPPYQTHPPQLPIQGSGFPGEKPDELNFGGQSNGWAGDSDPSRKLLHQTLYELDRLEGRLPYPVGDGYLAAETPISLSFPQKVNFDDRGYLWIGNANSDGNDSPVNGVVSGPGTPEPQLTASWAFSQNVYVYQRTQVAVYSPVSDSIFALRYLNSGTWLQELTKTYPITEVRPPVQLNPSQDPRNIIVGGGFLWASSQNQVWRIDPLTYHVGGIVLLADVGTTPKGYNDGSLLFVEETAFGDGFGRFFYCDNQYPTIGIHRIHPDTLVVEGSFIIPDAVYEVVPPAYDPTKNRIGVAHQGNVLQNIFTNFNAEPLGANPRTIDLSSYFGSSGQHFSVVYEPTTDRYWCYGYNSVSYTGIIVRVQDTGSALVVDDVYQIGIRANNYYSPTYPQLTLAGGYVWVVALEVAYTPPKSYRIFRIDPSTDEMTEVTKASTVYWKYPQLRGSVTGDFDNTVVERLGGVDGPELDMNTWDRGSSYLRTGMSLRISLGGHNAEPSYLPATQVSPLTGALFTHNNYNSYQGWCIRRSTAASTWTAQIRPLAAAVAGTSASTNHRLYLTDISGRLGEDDHIASSNRYGSIDPTAGGANPLYRIYGISGIGRSPQLGTSSFRMKTPYESLELTWSTEHNGWVISNRYRPWEDVARPNPVNPATIELSTGKAMVHVDTRTAAQSVNLPSLRDHDDWAIVKDSFGNAGANNITIGGNGKVIDGSSSFVINSNYGSVVLRYDAGGNSGVGSWEILSSNSAIPQWTVPAIVVSSPTLSSGRQLVRVDTQSASRVITLPASPTAFSEYVIKDYYGTCSVSRTITINASQGFDGGAVTSHVINVAYELLHVIWDGINWMRIG